MRARFWCGSAAPGTSLARTSAKGKDDTLFALVTGYVKFEDKGNRGRFISVTPAEAGQGRELRIRQSSGRPRLLSGPFLFCGLPRRDVRRDEGLRVC